MDPVTYIEAITIDGDRSIMESIQDNRGDELFRVLLRAIVIAAA
jgi:hypothetical protein